MDSRKVKDPAKPFVGWGAATAELLVVLAFVHEALQHGIVSSPGVKSAGSQVGWAMFAFFWTSIFALGTGSVAGLVAFFVWTAIKGRIRPNTPPDS